MWSPCCAGFANRECWSWDARMMIVLGVERRPVNDAMIFQMASPGSMYRAWHGLSSDSPWTDLLELDRWESIPEVENLSG